MTTYVGQCRYLIAFANRAFAGLDDSHRALEPRPAAKTAGWLIGHMCSTGDYARYLCGARPICPREWRALFSPGTMPSTDSTTYPSMKELCDTFHAVYNDLCTTAVNADPAKLAAANPYEPARPGFATAGDFAIYMMTGHLGYHLGQLTEWRAAAGLGRLPGAL
ncbi:MAG TPA: DinB family protein [Gemmatimonadaceae bacterium]|nr:DinB family protein [Gemmatimonadaceae bacterium]